MNASIQEVTDSAKALLAIIKENLREPLREAALLVSEFMQAIQPRCDGELRNLYRGYVYKHERMSSTLVSIKQTFIDYGKHCYFPKYCPDPKECPVRMNAPSTAL